MLSARSRRSTSGGGRATPRIRRASAPGPWLRCECLCYVLSRMLQRPPCVQKSLASDSKAASDCKALARAIEG